MDKIRVGLAGCGFAGSIHSRSLALARGSRVGAEMDIELVAAADADIDRAETTARQYGWQHTENDWRGLLKHSLDLVVVALPNDEHVEIVGEAVNKDAAVLLEKPVARTYEQSLEIRDAAGADSLVRVGYVNRFVPAVQAAKQFIDEGRIGDIRMFRSVYLLNMRQPGKPTDWRFLEDKAGGGASDDLGSHHLDLIEFLLGDVDSVQSTSRIWDIPDAPRATNDDATVAMLTLENGAIGTMNLSRTSPGHPLTGYLEIEGSEGALRIDRANLNDLSYRDKAGGVTQLNVRPAEPFVTMWASPTVQGAHPFSWYDCFAFQMAETLQLVAGQKPDTVWSASLDDGVRAMSITDAMTRAADTGCVVKLPTNRQQ